MACATCWRQRGAHDRAGPPQAIIPRAQRDGEPDARAGPPQAIIPCAQREVCRMSAVAKPSYADAVLEVEGLGVDIATPRGPLRAVRDVSFQVKRGETLCIVGESGCGKSITSLAVMSLLPAAAKRRATTLTLAWRRSAAGVGQARQRAARRPHGDDLPGADDRAEPGLHHRQPVDGGASAPPRRRRGEGARARDRAAWQGRYRLGGGAAGAVPAPALRADCASA